MAIRKAQPTRRKVAGFIVSRKSIIASPIWWEGVAMRALWQFLDVDPYVIRVEANAAANDSCGVLIHRFPAYVHGLDESYFLDIGSDAPPTQKKLAVYQQMQMENLQFRIYRQEKLQASHVVQNVRQLRRSRRRPPTPEMISRLASCAGDWPKSYQDVAQQVGGEGAADRLIVYGYLLADLWHPLSSETRLQLGKMKGKRNAQSTVRQRTALVSGRG